LGIKKENENQVQVVRKCSEEAQNVRVKPKRKKSVRNDDYRDLVLYMGIALILE